MKHLFLLPTILFAEMSGYIFDHHPPLYTPSSIHSITKLSQSEESIELDDGSVWEVSLYDGRKASYWQSGQAVSLTQNTKWFSSYYYRLIDCNTGSYIEINLRQATDKTPTISEVELSRNSLILSDRTHWKIIPEDSATLSNWTLQDPILIGDNCENSEWENILINAKKPTQFIRAHQFF